MKRIFYVAMIAAITALIVPVAGIGAQVTSQAAEATVYTINTAGGPAVDVWYGNDKVITALASNAGISRKTAAGLQGYSVCTAGSTAPGPACTGAAPVTAPGTLSFVGGGNHTVVIGPGFVQLFTNDTSPTELGNARFTLHNGTTALPIDICIDGVKIITALAPGGLAGGTSAVELKNKQGAQMTVVAPASGAACPLGGSQIPLAQGTNFVLTASTAAGCTTGCVQVLQVGEKRAANVAEVPAFCTAIIGLQGVQADLKAVYGKVTPGEASTYPSGEAERELYNKITSLITAGDKTVPLTEKAAWETVTKGLRDLTRGQASTGFDFSRVPKADQQKIVDGANGVNQTPDPEVDAATKTLTAFYTTSCIEVGFTG